MAVIMTEEQIQAVLPQRAPMLLIDEVTGLMPGDQVIASYTIPTEAPWLAGHYPAYPVVPSFMLLECLFQALQLCVLSEPTRQGNEMFMMEANKVKFSGRATPGDTVALTVKISKMRGEVVSAKCTATVKDRPLVSAEVVASVSGSNIDLK